ncbi:hypothetical protein CAPTEDRAFT_190336 [Capitella teleta]|uniref:Uncharacterized protein n=1 Tax=Capitella teleta TaxID=283909 RepID=R7VBS9_CAPTE|nr:hypothetical protein CAPTEDRAFT_190336 [Capitella teleta]|eukprot:ELU13751.1 hypothetical protein CAPTEDRAFT_190336 [Capitella teleta]
MIMKVHGKIEAHIGIKSKSNGSDLEITQHLQHALDEVSIEFNTIVLLGGDLNGHHPHLSESISTNTAGRLLQRFATVNALTQVIQAPTRVTANSSSCLDIRLTNIPEEINFLGITALLHATLKKPGFYLRMHMKKYSGDSQRYPGRLAGGPTMKDISTIL